VSTAVTPDTVATTICVAGWTATVRPPAAYTSALKVVQIVEYGYGDRSLSHYQEDHLVPLELGGAPRDPRNLWPEPNVATLPDGTAVGSDKKDDLENYLHTRVCAGTMGLRDAQRLIAGDWVTAWQQLVGPSRSGRVKSARDASVEPGTALRFLNDDVFGRSKWS
jgi:hypothetical protein